ncbi:hypothetical protein SLEP1_g17994 [Rubroshorea leprosula]|uniref:Uncharacterized protein n=1 Tax=Rubroshorea leprosula TaxID=152421 RepID=A0AAV5J3L7_9ROSI|nr:hypothetical protein SLEP1_g17994 [Rubroshorea leprosula]
MHIFDSVVNVIDDGLIEVFGLVLAASFSVDREVFWAVIYGKEEDVCIGLYVLLTVGTFMTTARKKLNMEPFQLVRKLMPLTSPHPLTPLISSKQGLLMLLTVSLAHLGPGDTFQLTRKHPTCH